jgi:dTDP-glucose 4,6-dehydratase
MNREFTHKTILVAGGMGFIGSNFIRYVLQRYGGVSIINFDKLTYSGNRDNLCDIEERFSAAAYVFVQGDVGNIVQVSRVFEAYRPAFVINFAAETHVDRSIHVGAKEFIDTNVTGVFNILEAVKTYGCEKYVQVSTDEVYGQLPNPFDYVGPMAQSAWQEKFTERSPFRPNVPYSATKAAGDCLCHAYHQTWNVPVLITHCSNNYGPYQYPEKLVPYWTSRLLKGEKIPLYGDGLNVRDWIYVDDHIRALILCLLGGKPGETYNIGADNERTNREMAYMIVRAASELSLCRLQEGEPYLEYVQDRPGHDRRYAIDATKMKTELGWEPLITADKFYGKLKEVIQWYGDHQAWVENVIARTGVTNAHIDLWRHTLQAVSPSRPHDR